MEAAPAAGAGLPREPGALCRWSRQGRDPPPLRIPAFRVDQPL